MSRRQSDGLIVPMKVGNATGGKAREGCSSQLCHAKPYREGKHCLYPEIGEAMGTKLERISQLSKENPEMVFTSVGHLINAEKPHTRF